MADKTYNAGEIEITQFDLVSLDGKARQSIISQVVTFDIYESIMMPLIFCQVMINDSINLIEKFPIIGEEYLEISFKNPELNSQQSFKFKTASVTNKFTEGQGKKLFYIINAASEELLLNSSRLIQRQYPNGNPYDMIADILTKDLKTKKKLRTDARTARGTDRITLTSQAPLQAIDLIRKRTVSKKYRSSSYVFFENREGFNFSTIEHLIFTGKNAIGDKIFFYDSNVNDSTQNINIRNILAYQQIATTNISDLVGEGGLANRTISLDLKTGSLNTIDFNFSQQIDKFIQTDSDNISKLKTSSFMNKYASKPGSDNLRQSMMPKSSNLGDSFREEASGFLKSYVNQLMQNITRVYVYGDAAVTAGNIIKLKFPEITGGSEKTGDSKLSSGNYLVTKTRHSFVVRDKVTYKMVLECVKPGFGESDV